MILRDLPPLSVSLLAVLCISTVVHANTLAVAASHSLDVCKDGGGGGGSGGGGGGGSGGGGGGSSGSGSASSGSGGGAAAAAASVGSSTISVGSSNLGGAIGAGIGTGNATGGGAAAAGPSGGAAGAGGSANGISRFATPEERRAFALRAMYFRGDVYRSTADCLTAAYTQRVPLDLCR